MRQGGKHHSPEVNRKDDGQDLHAPADPGVIAAREMAAALDPDQRTAFDGCEIRTSLALRMKVKLPLESGAGAV
jgi:hypothetical protein